MAGVLSIPYVVASGGPFPERSLILFLAAGVILFTLIAATILLPILSKGGAPGEEDSPFLDDNEARTRVLRVALNKIKEVMNEDNKAAAYQLMDEYSRLLKPALSQWRAQRLDRPEMLGKIIELHRAALKVERNYIQQAAQEGSIDKDMCETFEKALDHREEKLSQSGSSRFFFLVGTTVRDFRRAKRKYKDDNLKALGRDIHLKALQAALEYLQRLKKGEPSDNIIQYVILDYKRAIARLKGSASPFNEKTEAQKEELRLIVMDAERAEVNRMFENGDISREQARELRRTINQIEGITLFEHEE